MVCLGSEPGTAGWKVQTNPLGYGGSHTFYLDVLCSVCDQRRLFVGWSPV